MKLKRIKTIDRYEEIAEAFRRKGCLSNDYLQGEASGLIAEHRLFEHVEGNNAFLFVQKEGFYRLYYYLNDLGDVTAFDGGNLVTEVLFRGDVETIESEVAYLEKCGMNRHLVRDQYFARYADLTPPTPAVDVTVRGAESLEEVRWACILFNSVFDKWTGDYLPASCYEQLLRTNDILMATDSQGCLLGALHQTREKGAAWISHVAVSQEARGRGIGKALLEAYIDRNHHDDKSRYMLWVQRQNEAAVNMYKQKGFKYINKSTISLIKINA